jgi:hypothetical protein
MYPVTLKSSGETITKLHTLPSLHDIIIHNNHFYEVTSRQIHAPTLKMLEYIDMIVSDEPELVVIVVEELGEATKETK